MKLKSKKIIRMASDILAVICALLFVWMFISWVDIVTHNLDSQPVYLAWNLFTILF